MSLQGCGNVGPPSYADEECEHAVSDAINHIARRGDMLLSAACNVDLQRVQQFVTSDNVEDIQDRCFSKGAKSIEAAKVEHKADMLSKCKEALSGREVSNSEMQHIVGSALKQDKETSILAAMEKDQFIGIQKAKKEAGTELSQLRVSGAPPNLVFTTAQPTSVANLFATTAKSTDTTDGLTTTNYLASGYTTTNFIEAAEAQGMVTRFLPMVLDTKVVLQKVNDFKYRADNSFLKSNSPGLGYRVTNHIEDMDPEHLFIAWNHTIVGLDNKDGWIKCEVQRAQALPSSVAQTTSEPPMSAAGVAVAAAAREVMESAELPMSTSKTAGVRLPSIGQTTKEPTAKQTTAELTTKQTTAPPTAAPTVRSPDSSMVIASRDENYEDDSDEGDDSGVGMSMGNAVTVGLCLCGGMLAGGALVFGAAALVRRNKTNNERSLVPRSDNEAAALEPKPHAGLSPTKPLDEFDKGAASPASTAGSPQGLSPKHSAHEDAWKRSMKGIAACPG